jgi:glucan phosphoethanolaminetransferase (alkaline phosphatase superfamily)
MHYSSSSHGLLILLFIPFLLALVCFEIYMLVDAIRRPIRNKAVWIILILLVRFWGALLYCFIGRKKVINSELPTTKNT